MATSSLTKMTVPLANDQSSPTQGLIMPKLKYRFRVTFQNLGVAGVVTDITKQVVDFTRPNVTFENITPKDKIPTCSEAASAINQVMRFIASDITGDGMIVINNLKDTFFEIDNAKIGIKKTLEPDSLYNNWINPLNCKS